MTDYFTPIADTNVPERHKAILAKYRKLASEHAVPTTTAICYRVRAGFTLKSHAPKAGHCYLEFDYLQGWNFPDEPTTDCIVFWVPCILNGSAMKTKDQHMAFLSDLAHQLELPAHHLNGFGKIALVAGLILAHHKATGERIAIDKNWVSTDTSDTRGDGLDLGDYTDTGLSCDSWTYNDLFVFGSLGVFAIGMEPPES